MMWLPLIVLAGLSITCGNAILVATKTWGGFFVAAAANIIALFAVVSAVAWLLRDHGLL